MLRENDTAFRIKGHIILCFNPRKVTNMFIEHYYFIYIYISI